MGTPSTDTSFSYRLLILWAVGLLLGAVGGIIVLIAVEEGPRSPVSGVVGLAVACLGWGLALLALVKRFNRDP